MNKVNHLKINKETFIEKCKELRPYYDLPEMKTSIISQKEKVSFLSTEKYTVYYNPPYKEYIIVDKEKIAVDKAERITVKRIGQMYIWPKSTREALSNIEENKKWL